MKRAMAVLTVLVLGVGATAEERGIRSSREVKRSLVAFHAASQTAERGYEKMIYDGDQVLYVSRKPAFSVGEVTAARVVSDREGSGVQIGLSDDAAARLESLVGEKGGKPLAIMLNGELFSAPMIKSPITQGKLMLSGLDGARADRLVRAVNKAINVVPDGVILVADQEVGKAGDKILVDVLGKGLGDVRGYQIGLDVSGGEAGKLELDDIIIDSGRKNYVFVGTESFNATDMRSSRVVNALPAGSVHSIDKSYLATFVYRVSPDARGNFLVSVRGGDSTVFLDSAGDALEVRTAAETKISIR